MGKVTANRRARHETVSSFLAARSDGELAALVENGRAGEVGVGGGSARIDVDGVPVFAKRIPLTDLERANPHSTANLFGVPVFLQYGVVSPGFSAWRELAANVTVTDAVLSGETESFPLLHHWRVLPGRPHMAAEYADIDAAVAAMGGGTAVRARLEALAAASWSLVLFSELLPCAMIDWLREDPASKAVTVERQLSGIVCVLRDHELLHMDGHFGNIRADGERIFLTDFGLATSPRFDLSAAEQDFVRRNATHDADYAAMRLVNWLVVDVCGVPVPADGIPVARNEFVRRLAAGHRPDGVSPAVAAILARHAPAAARMNSFLWKLFDRELDAEYPGA